MKNTIVSLLIMMFLLATGTIAYAETGLEEETAGRQAVWQERKEILKDKVQSAKDLFAQVQPQVDEIKARRSQIASLKSESRTAYKDAVAHIKELKENQNNLSEEQLTQLQEATNTLKQNRIALNDSVGDIQSELRNLRSAQAEKNIEQGQEALNNIITIQESRIDLLKQSINDIKAILSI